MAGQPVKRIKAIKIRVTDAELERLKALCPKAQLAEWMREHCLGVAPSQRRVPPPPIDPALLRQLAGMGNNLNQIARRVNSGEWGPLDRVQIVAAMSVIARELEGLRGDHQVP